MRYLICLALIFRCFSGLASDEVAPHLVIRARIDGGINPVVADYVHDVISNATRKKAELVLIELNTPGGLMEATRQIVQDILASAIPVVVYVAPEGARAASAGVFITLASLVAAMAPSTHIGAAHPVGMFGGDIEGEMAKKVENDAAAWARSLAERNKRNTAWAEKAVIKSASITSSEALKQGIIEIIANNTKELLQKLDGRAVTVQGRSLILHTDRSPEEFLEMTTRQKIVNWLSDPNLLYLLMLFGFLLLFIEYQHPGLILPALLGVLCLALVFGVQLLPINWLGVLLIVGALALFIAEIYVTSFGLLTIGGIALLIFGSYLLFDVSGSTLRVNPLLIWTFAISFALLIVGFGLLIFRAKRQGPTSSVDAMVGETVEVFEAIREGKPGRVRLQGSFWEAYSESAIETGEKARVVRVDGTKVFVTKV